MVERFPAAVDYRAIAGERPYRLARIVADAATHEVKGFHMAGLNAFESRQHGNSSYGGRMKLDEARNYILGHPVMNGLFLDTMHLVRGVNVCLPRR
ncbi:MAG: hypothetical protein ABWW69_07890 [Pyrodictiaceae archaeon]